MAEKQSKKEIEEEYTPHILFSFRSQTLGGIRRCALPGGCMEFVRERKLSKIWTSRGKSATIQYQSMRPDGAISYPPAAQTKVTLMAADSEERIW
jgi:hypothetical protein